jgi:hypothetical protein
MAHAGLELGFRQTFHVKGDSGVESRIERDLVGFTRKGTLRYGPPVSLKTSANPRGTIAIPEALVGQTVIGDEKRR